MTNVSPWAHFREWCGAEFGPLLPEEEMLAYECRLQKGHQGGHDCQSARDAGYKDVTHTLRDPVAIEKFLGEK